MPLSLPLFPSAAGIIAIDLARQMLQMLPNMLTVAYHAAVAAFSTLRSRHHCD
jgi:hypothetical protein